MRRRPCPEMHVHTMTAHGAQHCCGPRLEGSIAAGDTRTSPGSDVCGAWRRGREPEPTGRTFAAPEQAHPEGAAGREVGGVLSDQTQRCGLSAPSATLQLGCCGVAATQHPSWADGRPQSLPLALRLLPCPRSWALLNTSKSGSCPGAAHILPLGAQRNASRPGTSVVRS